MEQRNHYTVVGTKLPRELVDLMNAHLAARGQTIYQLLQALVYDYVRRVDIHTTIPAAPAFLKYFSKNGRDGGIGWHSAIVFRKDSAGRAVAPARITAGGQVSYNAERILRDAVGAAAPAAHSVLSNVARITEMSYIDTLEWGAELAGRAAPDETQAEVNALFSDNSRVPTSRATENGTHVTLEYGVHKRPRNSDGREGERLLYL